MANALSILDRALLGGKFASRGLQARPMPLGPGPSPAPAGITTAAAPGRGLQYRPLSPGRSALAGGLHGLSGLLAALAAGRPEEAAGAFQGGMQGFDEQQRQRAADDKQNQLFDLELEDRLDTKQQRLEDKSAAAAAKAARESSIDKLVESGVLDEAEGEALKNDVGGLGDFMQKPETPTDDIREYNLYKQQGGTDDFTTWMRGNKRAGASSTTVKMPALETERDKSLGKLQGDAIGQWRNDAEAATQTLSQVQQMRESMAAGLQTGQFADVRQYASNVAIDLGVDQATVDKFFSTADAKDFANASNKMVLAMVKQLGPNPSNADRDFIVATIPTIKDNPQAIDAVLDRIEQAQQRYIDKFNEGYTAYTRDKVDPFMFELDWNKKFGLGGQPRSKGGKPAPTVIDGYTIEQVE